MERVFVFDGTCIKCSRWASWVEARGADVRFVPCAEAAPLLEAAGVDPADCEVEAIALEGDRVHRGAGAVAFAMRRTKDPLARLSGGVYRLPGVRQVSDRLYRHVAERRHG